MAAFTSFDSPKPSRLAHQREEGAARRRIRLTCMSANRRRRRPRAPCAHLRQPGQQRPNLEGARITPRPQESSTSLQKGLALAREESVAVVPGRSSRGERLKGKEALPTPLPRGEWRGRGGGGGCRHEPQRRA